MAKSLCCSLSKAPFVEVSSYGYITCALAPFSTQFYNTTNHRIQVNSNYKPNTGNRTTKMSTTPPSTALVRVSYDPARQNTTGPDHNKMVVPIRSYEENGDEYVVVRLTANGNEALRTFCHTAAQKEVWRFPSFEFVVRKGSLTVNQIRTGRASYVNALLIASRGLRQHIACEKNTRAVFGEDVRVPGFWGGSCAGCKWRDGAASCSYAQLTEPKYQPSALATLPRNIVEELED